LIDIIKQDIITAMMPFKVTALAFENAILFHSHMVVTSLKTNKESKIVQESTTLEISIQFKIIMQKEFLTERI